jgi:hypothetical protein
MVLFPVSLGQGSLRDAITLRLSSSAGIDQGRRFDPVSDAAYIPQP